MNQETILQKLKIGYQIEMGNPVCHMFKPGKMSGSFHLIPLPEMEALKKEGKITWKEISLLHERMDVWAKLL